MAVRLEIMAVSRWMVLFIVISFFGHVHTLDTLLFTATPGDQDNHAGLYGALITDEKGNLRVDSSYDFKFGYHCFHENGVKHQNFPLQSVAYDDVSGHVLLQKQLELHRDHVTLYEGHVCHNGRGCKVRNGPRILLEKVNFRYKKPKTFAYHNRTIYFLSQEIRNTEDDKKHNVIELRRFVGCHDKYPVTSYKRFEVDRCSEKLATLVDEVDKRVHVEPMSGLRVVQIDDQLYAFVTLQAFIFHKHELQNLVVDLYGVKLGRHDGTNEPYLLHSEVIGHATYRRYIMRQLGNVDYRDDKICWSAIDRVLCADLFAPRNQVKRTRYIVPPGAANHAVCRGEETYGNITTGVAIAGVMHDEVSLFFGCIAGVTGIGGSGFVRMRHWDFETTPALKSFGNSSTILYSGQMFLTDKCKYMKHSEKDTHVDYDLQSDQGSNYVQAESRSKAYSQNGCCLLIATLCILRTFLALDWH